MADPSDFLLFKVLALHDWSPVGAMTLLLRPTSVP